MKNFIPAQETCLYPLAEHRRYFKIAGITIQVESDLPISDNTFSSKLTAFESGKPSKDMVHIQHHFGLPNLNRRKLGRKVFDREDLTIYRNSDDWVFFIKTYDQKSRPLRQMAFANPPYTRISVFNDREESFKTGDIQVLSFYPTDQLYLTRILADRHGCIFHASGVNLDGKGLLFMGHSGAGKSTMVKMLKGKAEILCDDRIIVRREEDGFRIHGTWHHGEIPTVSPRSAPLKALLFLEKASHNRLRPVPDKTEVISRLVACAIKAIKPLSTSNWWEKTLAFLHHLASSVPCQVLEFDKSGKVFELLKKI